MKKINILKKNEDFQRIIKTQKAYVSKEYIIYIEKGTTDNYHFGISVSKKLGNAVIRNKLKRQIKDILDKKDYQNNFNCIIILRKAILNLNYAQKKMILDRLLSQLHIYKEEENVQK